MKSVVGLALLICAWPCFAGHVYRCPDGSFQDKPCGDGGVVVVKNRPPPQAGSDKACVEVAQRAEEVAKMKAQGVKVDAVLADIDNRSDGYEKKLQDKKFAVDAYKFGSPAEAKVSAEADCMAAKTKAAATAGNITDGGVRAPSTANSTQSAEQRAQQMAAERSTSERAARERKCTQYKDDLSSVREQQRGQNSVSAMEGPNKRKRDLEKKIWDACG